MADPLQLTAGQVAILSNLDAALHDAFSDGVDGNTPDLIAPIDGYLDKLTTLEQNQTRLIFKDAAAAIMAALNIPGFLADAHLVVPLAPATDGGTDGSLTFVDGILTIKVDPT